MSDKTGELIHYSVHLVLSARQAGEAVLVGYAIFGIFFVC